jgi:hypothetical protein
LSDIDDESFGVSAPVFAGSLAKGWEQLGKEKVSSRMERDEMRTASKGFVKQIAIEVRGTAVYFESVSVHLGKGEVIDLLIRSIIKAGERSRVFDLPGEARIIRKVVFHYKKMRGVSGKVEIILWGRK